ncbi:hypothetical protein MRB53_038151 [Persea americana]|nr:hypothetical protein MRB53_038151 [Persea americana]
MRDSRIPKSSGGAETAAPFAASQAISNRRVCCDRRNGGGDARWGASHDLRDTTRSCAHESATLHVAFRDRGVRVRQMAEGGEEEEPAQHQVNTCAT